MEAQKFLETNGRLLRSVSEVEAGDIVGYAHEANQVRIYYVDRVDHHPSPPHLIPPYPRAYFKPPHVGINLVGGSVFRHYIYMPMPGESCKVCWCPEINSIDAQRWECGDIVFPLYILNDGVYKKLGRLISRVETPSWNILCQTTEGPNQIFDFVQRVEMKFEEAKRLHDQIKEEARLISS